MENFSPSSNASQWPSSGSPTTSPQSKARGRGGRQSSPRPRTRGKSATGRSSGRPSGAKSRNRREELLRRLKIDPEALASQPQIAPLLRQCGVLPERLIEVLRVDENTLSQTAVRVWERHTPAERRLLGLEGIALLASMTPRRLWELYSGATMMQSRDSMGVMIAEALPKIMAVTIKRAKMPKVGHESREHILKAARVLPTPKGSVTNINLPGSQAEGETPELGDGSSGELEPADGFYLRASRAMGVKSLPAPPPAEVLDAEVEDEEE